MRHTGDQKENKGHFVELRLTCCVLDAALPERAAELRRWGEPAHAIGFYGTWHVRTAGYRGDAEMCLWLPPQPVPIGYVIQQTCAGGGVADGAAAVAVPMGLPPMGLPAPRGPQLSGLPPPEDLPVVTAVPVWAGLGCGDEEFHDVPVRLPP